MSIYAARGYMADQPEPRYREVDIWLAKIRKLRRKMRAAGMKLIDCDYRKYGRWASDGRRVSVDMLINIDADFSKLYMARVLNDLRSDLKDWNSGIEFRPRAVKVLL